MAGGSTGSTGSTGGSVATGLSVTTGAVETDGLSLTAASGLSEAAGSSDGLGLGLSCSSLASVRSPKICVSPPIQSAAGKLFYSSPACTCCMTRLQTWAAGLP